MIGSLILGVKNNSPLQMIRCLSVDRKTLEHGACDGNNICSRPFVCFVYLVIANYCSLVDIFWGSEVIGKPYFVRSADENVGGSVGVCWFLFCFRDSIDSLL